MIERPIKRVIAAKDQRLTDATFDNIRTPQGVSGLRVDIDITAFAGGTNVVFSIRGYYATNGGQTDLYTVLASAAQTTTGRVSLVVHPAITAAANAFASAVLPFAWQLQADVTGTFTALTYEAVATYTP